MFCTNCGKEINENASFCSNCGKQILKTVGEPLQQSAETVETVTPSEPKPIEKTVPVINAAQPIEQKTVVAPKEKGVTKKTTIIITLIVVVVFGLIGKFVIAPSYMNDSDDDYEGGYEDYDDYDTEDDYDYLSDSSYNSIFSTRNIVDSPASFFGLDTAEFAIAKSDGSVEKMAYGYEDDVIEAWDYTIYLTEDIIGEDFYNELKSLNFCTASKRQVSDYYVVTFKFKNLDNVSNINKLVELGILESSGDYMSYSKTANQLISAGYAEK